MALSTQESDEDKHFIFVAKMDNARNMITILKAVHFKDVSILYGFQISLSNIVDGYGMLFGLKLFSMHWLSHRLTSSFHRLGHRTNY